MRLKLGQESQTLARQAAWTSLRSRAVLDRLPGADIHKPNAYGCKWMPRDKHMIGKGSAVNRNNGFRSKLRSKLNRLMRRTKGYAKSVDMLKHLPAIALEERLNQSTKSISATR